MCAATFAGLMLVSPIAQEASKPRLQGSPPEVDVIHDLRLFWEAVVRVASYTIAEATEGTEVESLLFTAALCELERSF